MNVKRRDLLREHSLQPRDLRRIDPAIDFTKTSPSVTIKENVLLLNLGGIRAIVDADKALLFEPNSANTRKLLDTIVPRLQAAVNRRIMARAAERRSALEADAYRRDAFPSGRQMPGSQPPPFELEVLEGVLTVSTGRLDAEVRALQLPGCCGRHPGACQAGCGGSCWRRRGIGHGHDRGPRHPPPPPRPRPRPPLLLPRC
jgi:magnesium transporter